MVLSFDLADKFLRLTGPKSSHELEHAAEVFVLTDKVDIDSNIVHNVNVDKLKAFSEASLVNVFLHGVEAEC